MSIAGHSTPAAEAAPEYRVVVLLIDDQPLVGEAVRRALLDEQQLTFHYCGDPSRAVALAHETKPTVILQDLVMPGVNGLDLVRRYRGEPGTAAIPIIVLSTKEEATVKSEAFKAGANDYLVKLPDRVELVARIRYHSAAYMNHLQRDAAYRALRESQQRLMETNRELQRLTNVDGLTGLSNRRYFKEYIEAEWKRALRGQTALSLLMIDVDYFKQYNDTYGHVAGDEVLKQVARTVGDSFKRSTDLAARYGGEEFVVILPETPPADTEYLARKLCMAVQDLHLPHAASNVAGHVTISVGGATTVPDRGQSFFLLVDAADKALYEAKRAGRNCAVTRECTAVPPPRPTA
ncbi:MAG: diguanylate cyclase [Methylobacteriaceae bacterium]|nr:diguanylate cyclase [Methylobacteriaceae bacterium]